MLVSSQRLKVVGKARFIARIGGGCVLGVVSRIEGFGSENTGVPGATFGTAWSLVPASVSVAGACWPASAV